MQPVRMARLFSSQKSNARGEGATVKAAESEELRRAEGIVHRIGILVIGDVVETAANCPIESDGMKTFFQMQVEGEITRETISSRGRDQLLLRRYHCEGESRAPFKRVAGVEAFHEWQQSPGDEAVGRVPRIGAGDL